MHLPLAEISALALLSSRLAFAQRPHGKVITLTNNRIRPDGVDRIAITPDSKVVGPLIKFKKGEIFDVTIKNQLNDTSMRRSTSIHWHGFHQNQTSSQDGAAFVTQCPIAPDDSFNYKFPIGNQAGTFWYHSHLSTQYCDGLRGPIVIKDPEDYYLKAGYYNVDEDETVITLADHYHTPAPSLARNWIHNGGPAPPADSTLVNGIGRSNSSDTNLPWHVIEVAPGNRYRFRWVNIACDTGFTVSIQGHGLSFIEADSQPTMVYNSSSFDIYPGQRYSTVVETNVTAPGLYWIFVTPIGQNTTRYGRAILKYKGAGGGGYEEPPEPQPTAVKSTWREDSLEYLDSNDTSLSGDAQVISLNIGLIDNSPFFTVNNISWVPPPLPALLQILSGGRNPADFIPSENIIILQRNRLYELKLTASSRIPITHPIHLHGHSFGVVRYLGKDSDPATAVRKDVVTMVGGAEVGFRFRTDNPGPWILHCHIDWHLETGLAVVFAEAPEDVKDPEDTQDPDGVENAKKWKNLCPKYEALSPDKQ